MTALFASQAITAALFARERGRGGQHVELSMTDAVVSFLWADSAANEVLLESDGTAALELRRRLPPDAVRRTVGASSRRPPTATSPACAAASASTGGTIRGSRRSRERIQHRELMAEIMDLVYAQRGQPDHGRGDGAPRGRAGALRHDPHARRADPRSARGRDRVCSRRPTTTSSGRTRLPRHPTRFGATPARLTGGSPALGEHTDEILTELGLAAGIADLRAQGVVA